MPSLPQASHEETRYLEENGGTKGRRMIWNLPFKPVKQLAC